MRTRTSGLATAFAFALATTALALETPADHERHPKQTITLDTADLRPESLTMDRGETISFVNSSTHPYQVTFIEPKDLEKRIRCGLIRTNDKDTPAAPWALFMWQNGKLTANVPPGQFASVCALEPGTYAFTAERIGHRAPAADTATTLPLKGRIEVK